MTLATTASTENEIAVPSSSRAPSTKSLGPSTRQTYATKLNQPSALINPDHALSSSLDNVASGLESEVSSSISSNLRNVQYESTTALSFSSLQYMDALNLVEKLCKAFGPRNIQPSLNKSYLLCKLRSYPNMILSGGTPPFIHRYYGYGIDAPVQVTRPAPLKNCANIILWNTKKDNDNIEFIWGTVQVETERLLEEVQSPGFEKHFSQ